MLPSLGDKHPEQLQLPNVRRAELMPSLPAWVASRIASLKLEIQPSPGNGKWRQVWTLPENLTLKVAERDELGRHAAALRDLCKQTPDNDRQAEDVTLLALTKMMLVLPSTTQNELSAEARGEAYMAALGDLPPWATQAAIRRWHRGDCGRNDRGQPYDYHWCPAPAELRRVALGELQRIRGRAENIEQLLRAEVLIEFTDEHRCEMRRRFLKLLASLGTPLVGKDGSGGAVGKVPPEGAHCGTQPRHSPA
jgi:hypothetical protein